MEEIMYNILWIDDEHETLSGTKGRAKRNGINLIPFKSLNGGMSEMERNYSFYDGVLLDAKFFENEEDVKGSEDTYNVHRAKEQLLQLKKKFEVFVLTGQAEAYNDNTFKKAFVKVYKKGSDAEIDRLLIDIKESAKSQPDTQIRHENSDVFSIFAQEYLSKEVGLQVLELIKSELPINRVEIKSMLTNIRSIHESCILKLEEIRVLPDAEDKFSKIVKHLSEAV